jgi:oxygen-independent coproporphyrinogen-3 oxidase
MSGLYLHIPFCKQACSYCDFYFVTRQSQRQQYVNALLKEIKAYAGTLFTAEPVQTIYFGGGTPSLLTVPQVDKIMAAIWDTFDVRAEEITLEMNPDDVTEDYLSDLSEIGINRASMGVQSFQPELLRFMHRAHTRGESLQSLELLSQSAFDSFTIDLIYGNPGQSLQELSNDLSLLLEFNPRHISAYSLTVEPNTPLGKKVELGRINPPAEDSVAEQFTFIGKRLKEHGILRYEVSNYSKPGFEASHNSNYWQHKNYLGLGPAAHSFWWNKKPKRWQNRSDLKEYLSSPGEQQQETEILSHNQLAEERIMLGLRTRSGISPELLSKRYNYDLNSDQKAYLQRQEQCNMLQYRSSDESVQLTEPGLLLADTITLDLISLQ